jgi:phosphoserine phosphatase
MTSSPAEAALVATFVCDPARPALTDALLARAAQELPGAGAPAWLDPGVAADVFFAAGAGLDRRSFADRARAALDGAPADVIVQPAAGRRKRLFLADMDSTMIGQECIDELADMVGLKARVAEITERAMRGEIAFEPALRERVALLAGLDAGVVDRLLAERITLTPGGTALVRTMKAHGAHTSLVSGGFTVFTSRIGEAIGFHENRANTLLIEDGRFAGHVTEPILGKAAKLATLKELTASHELSPEQTLAIGDGANDLAMLEAAGLGVAYHAKPAVAAAAQARVDHGDLTALLFAQGFAAHEFVTE